MMINTPIEIAENTKCESISKGTSVDAELEEKKENRKRFYKNISFTLKFDEEECRNDGFYCKVD